MIHHVRLQKPNYTTINTSLFSTISYLTSKHERRDGDGTTCNLPPATTATAFPTSNTTMVHQATLLLLVAVVAGEDGSSLGVAPPGGVCQADGCEDLQVGRWLLVQI